MVAIILIAATLPLGNPASKHVRANQWPTQVVSAGPGKHQCETEVTLARGLVGAVRLGDLVVIDHEVRGAITWVGPKTSRAVVTWPSDGFGKKTRVVIRPANVIPTWLMRKHGHKSFLEAGHESGVRELDDVYKNGRFIGKVSSVWRDGASMNLAEAGHVFIHITGWPKARQEKLPARGSMHVRGVVRVPRDRKERRPDFTWTDRHSARLASEGTACKDGFTDACARALGLYRARKGEPTLKGHAATHEWQCKKAVCPHGQRCQATPSSYL